MKKVNKQLGMLQRAGAEKLGRAEKSVEELPEHLNIIQRHHESTRISCERVQKKLTASLQGSGSEYEKRVKKLPQTALANCLHEASGDLGTTPLAVIMDLCGDVIQRMAMQTACFELLVEQQVITPVGQFLEHDASALEKLFKKLQKARLEMDSAASKVHKLEKKPPGAAPEPEEKRLREEMESTETKFQGLQGQYVTDLLEVASKEHGIANYFYLMMKDQLRYHEECISRLNQTVPKIEEIINNTPFRPAFGTDLAVHCAVNQRPVSVVIESCCAALLPHINSEQGLFRLAGSVSQVKKLKAHLDYGMLDFADLSPHTITGALKLYLRELPDPLFTLERYDTWKALSVMGEDQHSEKMQSLYTHLHDLPDVNYVNVRYLMVFLQKMTEFQEVTKMGASNLALVIGPNLFQTADAGMHDTGPLCNLVENIISHADYFFPEGCEISETVPPVFYLETVTMGGDVPRRNSQTFMRRNSSLANMDSLSASSAAQLAVSAATSSDSGVDGLASTHHFTLERPKASVSSFNSFTEQLDSEDIEPGTSPAFAADSGLVEKEVSPYKGTSSSNTTQAGKEGSKASKLLGKVKQKMK